MKVACSQCGRARSLTQLSAGLLCDVCRAAVAAAGDCFGTALKQSQCLFCFDRKDCEKVAADEHQSRRSKRRG